MHTRKKDEIIMKLGLGLGLGNTTQASSSAPASLQETEASTVFHLDATRSESYSGSGTNWANLVAAPSDGETQAAYDFTLSSMTFNGSAGDQAAYFGTGGAGTAQIGANTTFTNALHRTTGGSDWWFLIAWQSPTADAAADSFFTTQNTTFNDKGTRMIQNASEVVFSRQRGDTGVGSSIITTGVIPGATNGIIIMSYDESAGQSKVWINSTTEETFTNTYNACNTDADGLLTLFSSLAGSANSIMASSARIYAVAMGDAYLDSTAVGNIITALESSDWHNRDYTP